MKRPIKTPSFHAYEFEFHCILSLLSQEVFEFPFHCFFPKDTFGYVFDFTRLRFHMSLAEGTEQLYSTY